MALVRWNPTRDLLKVERDFNKIFRNFFNRISDKESENGYSDAVWAPLADVAENDNEYIINYDLPGIDKKDIKVSFSNGVLSVSGERKEEKESKNANYYSCERSYGKFYRSFTLPDGIKEDAIDAKFENGTLRIVVPKAEERKPKQIDIKVN